MRAGRAQLGAAQSQVQLGTGDNHSVDITLQNMPGAQVTAEAGGVLDGAAVSLQEAGAGRYTLGIQAPQQQAGTAVITVRAQDAYETLETLVTVEVRAEGLAAGAIAPRDVVVGETVSISIAEVVENPSQLPLTYDIAMAPADGSASIDSAGTLTYTPGTQAQTEYVEVRVSNGVQSVQTTVALRIYSAPVLLQDTRRMMVMPGSSESFDAASLYTERTPDSTGLSISAQPAQGTASVSGSQVTYTASSAFAGEDRFSVCIENPYGSVTAHVVVTAGIQLMLFDDLMPLSAGAGEDEAPLAHDDAYTISESGPYTMNVLDNDQDRADGGLVLVDITQQPAQAQSIQISGSAIVYTPREDAQGSDSFAYAVRHAEGTQTATATVSITFEPGNVAHTVSTGSPVTVGMGEDIRFSFTIEDEDGGDMETAYQIRFAADNGALFPSGTSFSHSVSAQGEKAARVDVTVMPAADVFGESGIDITVSDGVHETHGTQHVSVTKPNEAPVIGGLPPAATIDQGGTYTTNFTVTDEDAQDIAGVSVTASAEDSALFETCGVSLVSTEGHTATYTLTAKPLASQAAPEGVTVTVSADDGIAAAVSESLTLTIEPVNSPAALSLAQGTVSCPEGGPVVFAYTIEDADGIDLGAYDIGYTASNDQIIAPGTDFVVTPSVSGNTATMTVSVAAIPQSNTVDNGPLSVTVSLSDQGLAPETVTQQVEILPVNDAPELALAQDRVTSAEDNAITFVFYVSDVDGVSSYTENSFAFASTNATVISAGAAYDVSLAEAEGRLAVTVTVQPEPYANTTLYGAAGVTITVTDGGHTLQATQAITVTPVGNAPEISGLPTGAQTIAEGAAYSQTFTVFAPDITDFSQNLTVEAAASGSNADVIESCDVSLVSSVAHVATYQLTVTPHAYRYALEDIIITVTATEGGLAAAPCAFDLVVAPVNDAPVLSLAAAMASGVESTPLSFTFTVEDRDGVAGYTAADFSFASSNPMLVAEDAEYSVSISPVSDTVIDVTVTVDPVPYANTSKYGGLTITIAVQDDPHFPTIGQDVELTPVNDAPEVSLAQDTVTFDEDDAITFVFYVSDVDGVSSYTENSFAFATTNAAVIAEDAAYDVSLAEEADGTLTVTVTVQPEADANTDQHGAASVVITIDDGEHTPTLAQAVTVTPINDAPEVSLAQDTVTSEENDAITFVFYVSDVDGVSSYTEDSFTFASTNAAVIAADAAYDVSLAEEADGTLAVTVTVRPEAHANTDQHGDASVTITIDDDAHKPTLTQLVKVTPINDAPEVSLAQDTVTFDEDDAITFVFYVSDVDGVSSYTENSFAFATTNEAVIAADAAYDVSLAEEADGTLTVTVTVQPVAHANTALHGAASVTITIDDGEHTPTLAQTVVLDAINDAPEISGLPTETQTIAEGATYTQTFTVFDPDITEFPQNLTVEAAVSGSNAAIIEGCDVSFVSSVAHVATYQLTVAPYAYQYALEGITITVTATDGELSATPCAFDLVVTAVNDLPALSLSLDTAPGTEDTTLSFTFTLEDMDGTAAYTAADFAFASSNPLVVAADADYTVSITPFSDTVINVTVTVNPVAHANTDEYGPLTITITAQDDPHFPSIGQKIEVAPVNDAPEITIDSMAEMNEDGQYTFTFTVTDPDVVNPLTGFDVVLSTSDTALPVSCLTMTGPVKVDARTARYTVLVKPPKDMNAADGVTITAAVSDNDFADVQSCLGNLLLKIHPVNDPPVLKNDAYTLNEDTATWMDVLANDVDVEGHETMTITLVEGIMDGASVEIIEEGRALLYTPKANYYGRDSFTYTVTDGEYERTAVVNVIINSVNDLPEFLNLQTTPYETQEDVSFSISILVTDVETADSALALQATVTGGANIIQSTKISNGSAEGEKVLSITLSPNMNGDATIALTLGDGQATVKETIAIHVEAVNDPPKANDDTIAFDEDEPLSITAEMLLANDVDVDIQTNGDVITIVGYEEVNVHGTLEPSYEGGVITGFLFTPEADNESNVTFEYTIRDTSGEESTALVTLKCVPHNDPPVIEAIPDQIMAEDSPEPLRVPAVFSDPEVANADLVVSVGSSNEAVLPSSSIRVDKENGCLYIQPLANMNGKVIITVSVSDGDTEVHTTFELDITPMPDAPIAVDDQYTAIAGRMIVLKPLENDYEVDGEAFWLESYTEDPAMEASWLAEGPEGTLYFTAPSGTQGTYVIPYAIKDEAGDTGTASITVTVTAFGIGPMIMQVSPILMSMEKTLSIPLEVHNVEAGQYTLTVSAADGTVLPEGSVSITGTDSLTPTLVIDPSSAGVGTTELTLTLTTESAGGDEIVVPITLTRVNTPPEAADDTGIVKNEGTSFTIDVLANDDDAQRPLDIKIYSVTQPAHGTVTISGDHSKLHYAWNSSNHRSYFHGTETFTYTIVDGGGLMSTATVEIEIVPVDTQPYAYGEYVLRESIAKGETVTIDTVLNNDYDNDSWVKGQTIQNLSVSGIPATINLLRGTSPTGKSVTATKTANGAFTFQAEEEGWYAFAYTVTTQGTDGEKTSNEVTCYVGVTFEDPIPPKLSGNIYYNNEDCGTITRDITNQVKAPDLTLISIAEGSPYDIRVTASHGQDILKDVSMSGQMVNGEMKFFLTYTAIPDMSGSTTMKWQVAQANPKGGDPLLSEGGEGTITVHIYEINDPPVITLGQVPQTVARGELVQIPVTITDVDHTFDQLLVTKISSDSVVISSEGIRVVKNEAGGEDDYFITFTPSDVYKDDLDKNNIIITLRVSDGAASDTAEFTVKVEQNNRAPVALDFKEETILEDGLGEFNVVAWGSDEDADPLTILFGGDAEGTGLSYPKYAGDPSKWGYVDVVGKKILYTPANDHFTTGDDDYVVIKYRLQDSEGEVSDIGTIHVRITPVNDQPEIFGLQSQSDYLLSEDVERAITFTVRDIDLDAVTITAAITSEGQTILRPIDPSEHISITPLGNGEYSVTLKLQSLPDAFHGESDAPVSIAISATDGIGAPTVQVIQVVVSPVNDPVQLKEGSLDPYYVRTKEDTGLTINLRAMYEDIDGDEIHLVSIDSLMDKGREGSVVNQNGSAYFMPAKDFCHAGDYDSLSDENLLMFTYKVSDPYEGSATGTVYVYVEPVNDLPVAGNKTININEDTETDFTVHDLVSDVDNPFEELTILVNMEAQNGTITKTDDKTYHYVPDRDWFGTEVITYTVADLEGQPVTGRVTINVASVVDTPRITFDDGSGNWDAEAANGATAEWVMDEDTTGQFTVRVWQPESNLNPLLRISIQEASAIPAGIVPRENIKLSGSGEYLVVSIEPLENMFGELTLELLISDGTSSRDVTVYAHVTIRSVNDLPEMKGLSSTGSGESLVYSASATTKEDTAASGTVSGTDIETIDTSLLFSVSAQPAHGTATIARSGGANWKWTYTPEANYYGADSFRIAVTDADKGVREAVISLTVTPVNDPPQKADSITLDRTHYADGDTVTVTLGKGSDIETATPDLTYALEVSYNGTTWTKLAEIGHDGVSGTYQFTVSGGHNTDKLLVRARTWDTIIDGASPRLSSVDYAVSLAANVDNTAPQATHTQAPAASVDTNGDVVITVLPTDTGVGASGVASITCDGPTRISDYTYTVPTNGTYRFVITDNVGNAYDYDVTISNIDKVDPHVAATPEGIAASEGVYADTGRTVQLTYTDNGADTSVYKNSGVKLKKYLLTEEAQAPAPPDGYLDYSSSIPLDTRGTWYIHAYVMDNANNTSLERFGPYEILNSAPKEVATIPAKSVNEGPDESVTFDLSAYVTDVDGDSTIVTYTIDLDQNSEYGVLTHVSGTTYQFTHNGKGDAPFVTELSFAYSVVDDEGAAFEGTVPVTVVEVNDIPEAPTLTGPASGYYQDGDSLTLSWTAGTDEETEASGLTYEVEINYSGNWEPVGTTEAGATGYTITIASNKASSNSLQARVRTVDGGINGGQDVATSEWATSAQHILDNEEISLSHTQTPTDMTNGNVTLILTPVNVGESGIRSLTHNGTPLTAEEDGTYELIVEQNGSYSFTLTNQAGQQCSHTATVTNIDKLLPFAQVSPEGISAGESRYADSGMTVTIGYADAGATAAYASSGVSESQYALTQSTDAPTEWTSGGGTESLDERDTWYVHTYVKDVAGNEQTQRFGPYEILNSAPKEVATIPAKSVNEGPDESVTFDLAAYVTDVDGDSTIVTYTIDLDQNSEYGELTHVSGTTYQFTHNGQGDAPFVTELTFDYSVVDDEGAAFEGTVPVTVVEVNDIPEAPEMTGPASGYYQDGDSLTLSWTAGTDEETEADNLTYEVEINYSGNWEPVGTTEAGATGYTITIASNKASSNSLQARVRTVDGGINGGQDVAKSEWATSAQHILDNEEISLSHIQTPTDMTNGNVTLILTPVNVGESGVRSLTHDGTALTAKPDGTYELIVEQNGSYSFTLTNQAGQQCSHTATVTNIDKLVPEITPSVAAIGAEAGIYAPSGQQLVLTFADPEATATDAQSGLGDLRYAVTKDASAPAANDSGWSAYTGDLSLDEKGSWYVHAYADDLAGNVTIASFGPYVILNTPPEEVATIPEKTVNEGPDQSVTFDLAAYVTDVDGDSTIVTYNIDLDQNSEYGELTHVNGTTYQFTHNGKGDAPFVTELTFAYSAADDEGATYEGTVPVTVVEVNDIPEAPTLTGPPIGYYQDGDSLTLSWNAGTDEETEANGLTYEVEINYSGNWETVGTTEAGATGYTITIASDKASSNSLQARGRTVDGGINGGQDVAKSEWATSAQHILDNEEISLSHTQTPTDMTNGNVTLILTPVNVGDSGVRSLTHEGTALTAKPDGTYELEVAQNGSYSFTLTNQAGQQCSHTATVTNIDKLVPFASAQPESIGESDGVYAISGAHIELASADAPETDSDASSGVLSTRYLLTQSGDKPAQNDGNWAPYTAPIALDEKGTWYLHVRVEDIAGNVAIQTFGAYVVRNSTPEGVATPPEKGVLEGPDQSVDFDLSDYVTDADGGDTLVTYAIDLGQHSEYGSLTSTGGSAYRFTHNGKGDAPFVTELTFAYSVVDDEGASYAGTVPVTVTEVNDLPDAPASIAPAGGFFKDGDELALSWSAGDDEETAVNDLQYEVSLRYGADGDWPQEQLMTAQTLAHTLSTSGENTTLQLRVRTVDGGIHGGADIARSDWTYSAVYVVDNDLPSMTHTATPTAYTNGDVLITLIPLDEGGAGVEGITLSGGAALAEQEGNYLYTATQNGTYTFLLADKSGNQVEYPVTVTNIDKLVPEIAPSVTEISPEAGIYATSGQQLGLTFADPEATETDAQSGLNSLRYAVTKDASAPAADGSGWSAYTGDLSLDEKGSWYVHAYADDLAGNVTIASFGPYVILNTPPQEVAAIPEKSVSEGPDTSVTFDLSAYVTDVDGDDTIVTYNIDLGQNSEYGVLTHVSGTTYQFTHNGKGDAPFVTDLTFDYSVVDDEGASYEGTVPVTVVEVNDVPEAPTLTGPASGYYQDGDSLTLAWNAGTDEETEASGLTYEVEINYSGNWEPVGTTEAGATGYTITIASDKASSNSLQARVRTVDTGINGGQDVAKSDWATSAQHILDNEEISLSHTQTPTDMTNGNVTLILTPMNVGESGIQSLMHEGTALTAKPDGTYELIVEQNGSYSFTLTNQAGQQCSHTATVTNIDKLAPSAQVSPEGISAGESRFANSGMTVTIGYADAAATDAYASSGVSESRYAVTQSTDAPAEWTAGGGTANLDRHGTWYVHTYVKDVAGNEQTQRFGPYEILNSLPTGKTPASLTVAEGPGTAVTIHLLDYVEDADGSQTLTLALEALGSLAYGTLEDQGGGVYRFTHNGKGDDKPFADKLTFHMTAKDDAGATYACDILLNVVEENDLPTTPEFTGPAQAVFKNGDTLALAWTAAEDEETDAPALVYEVQVRYGSGEWTALASKTGETAHDVTVGAAELSDEHMQLRLRAIDDGIGGDLSTARHTDWAYSPEYGVDNQPPRVEGLQAQNATGPYTPGQDSHSALDITFGFVDDGISGLKTARYLVSTNASAPGTAGGFDTVAQAQGNQVRLDQTGEYYLHMHCVDEAGNAATTTYGPFRVTNTAPTAADIATSVVKGGKVEIALEGTDPEGDALTFAVDTEAVAYGTLQAQSEGVYTYTHGGDSQLRTDTFTYTAIDPAGQQSLPATVTIAVEPAPYTPGGGEDPASTATPEPTASAAPTASAKATPTATAAASATAEATATPEVAERLRAYEQAAERYLDEDFVWATDPSEIDVENVDTMLVWWVLTESKPDDICYGLVSARLLQQAVEVLNTGVELVYMTHEEMEAAMADGKHFDMLYVDAHDETMRRMAENGELRALNDLVERERQSSPWNVVTEESWQDASILDEEAHQTIIGLPKVMDGKVWQRNDDTLVNVINAKSPYADNALELLRYASFTNVFSQTFTFGIKDLHYDKSEEAGFIFPSGEDPRHPFAIASAESPVEVVVQVDE